MNGTGRFAVFMLVAVVVFITVLLFVMRKRVHGPDRKLLALTTFVVVVLGMLFGRYAYIFFRPPWWIYYGLPALSTFLLPPMVLRMTRDEILQYVPLAVLMAPVIHVFFSLFIGWHDYMPFPIYVPSLVDVVQRIR